MKNKIKPFILFSFIFCLILFSGCEKSDDTFTFVVAADMRYTAKEEYRNSQYFQGACEAIKKFGKGSFMISPGDIDPPSDVREVITKVLGEDYPWYPVVGNHELDADSYMVYLRNHNKDDKALPNLVNKGPPGCEETTYSFSWGDHHFIVLNQYFDGTSDNGTDGDMVPELLDWLKKDLKHYRKRFTFVFGHEPLIAMPDMDNGRIRHQDDSLNKYPASSFKFYQVLIENNVTAYICGHTHNTSLAKINGLWQIDVGHARGIEDVFPDQIIQEVNKKINIDNKNGLSQKMSIEEYFRENAYKSKKVLYYMDLTDDLSYKNISDEQALPIFKRFYEQYQNQEELRTRYRNKFWENANLTRSTFLKIQTVADKVKIEIYRDDARGGDYSLMHTKLLN